MKTALGFNKKKSHPYPTRNLADFARTLASAVAEAVETPLDKAFKAVSEFARGFRLTMTLDELSGMFRR